MTDVSVVIGNFEGESVLPACFDSLEQQTVRPVEVIVVDASSSDGSRAVAEARGARWIELPNLGLGRLYNRGVEATSSEYVLLSNNDVAYDERCVERLGQALDADSSLFAADPRQLDWDAHRLVHARTTLHRGSLFHELLPGLHLDLASPADEIVPTVTANGAAMLVRRSAFLELGGFDETFFMDLEDIDLCWRAWLRGRGSVYVPDAWLRHRVGAVTTKGVLPRRLASSHHNLARFALKCLPGREALVVIVGELLRLPRHPMSISRGLAQVVPELPQIVAQRRLVRPTRSLLRWFLAGQPAGWSPVGDRR
jgi:N-acetylglucosaminyl-diphospho-decaprenol L-rhamnosyltransferase